MASSCRVLLSLLLLALASLPAKALFSFVDQPRDTAVQRGRTAVLRCSVDRYTNSTTVSWWKRDLGRSISHNRLLKRSELTPEQLERFSITGDPSRGEFNLQIVNFTDGDAAPYACQIYSAAQLSSFSSFTPNAQLTVAPYDPRCYVESKSEMPLAGDEVNLVCASRNQDTSESLMWFFHTGRGVIKGNTTQSFAVKNKLTLSRVLKPDDYDVTFICFEDGRRCSVTPLRRYIPVLISTAKTHPTIGDTVTYSCRANNDLTPLSYSWSINGVDIGFNKDVYTIEGIDASYNGSVIDCAVKHSTGFKGNDSIVVILQPEGGGIRTSTLQSTHNTPNTEATVRVTEHAPISDTPKPAQNSSILSPNQKTSLGDEKDNFLMPLVITASVVGLLLTIVIALLTVFLSRQRAPNTAIGDATMIKHGARGPPSDCVLVNTNGDIGGSPSVSVGTLKGFKNPAGCGSMDTFELDLDPDSQPDYYVLEHTYYEATIRKDDSGIAYTDNPDSGFDGIEVSELITPDCELANRKFSFGSGGPPSPVPPASPLVPTVTGSEVEGREAPAEALVTAYAVTNVARHSPPVPRGESLKRPLPARPNDGGYRAPAVHTATGDRGSPFGRFRSVKTTREPPVGVLARSHSLKRPLPATPRTVAQRSTRAADPYKTPGQLISRIPPFLTSENTNSNRVTAAPEPAYPAPNTKSLPRLKEAPVHRSPAVPCERLSAVVSVCESDYAEIELDRAPTERDSLLSGASAGLDDRGRDSNNDTQSTLDAAELDSTDDGMSRGPEVCETDYDVVAESDEDDMDTPNQSLSPAVNTTMQHSLSDYLISPPSDLINITINPSDALLSERTFSSRPGKSPLYARVRKSKSEGHLQPMSDRKLESKLSGGN